MLGLRYLRLIAGELKLSLNVIMEFPMNLLVSPHGKYLNTLR